MKLASIHIEHRAYIKKQQHKKRKQSSPGLEIFQLGINDIYK